jgi:hypothetical protein
VWQDNINPSILRDEHGQRIAAVENELVSSVGTMRPAEALGRVDTYRSHKMMAARVTTAR